MLVCETTSIFSLIFKTEELEVSGKTSIKIEFLDIVVLVPFCVCISIFNSFDKLPLFHSVYVFIYFNYFDKIALLSSCVSVVSDLNQQNILQIRFQPGLDNDPKPIMNDCILQLLPSPKVVFVKRSK